MSERSQGISAEEIRRCLDGGGAPRLGPAAAVVRVQVALDRRHRHRREHHPARGSAACCWRSSRPGSPPARTSCTSSRWRSPRRARFRGGRGRSRTPTAGSSYDALAEPEQAHELLRRIEADDEIETDEGRFSFHPVEGRPASAETTSVRADGRRAVELVARVRRHDRAEGVPQARAGHQPRARGPALPHLAQASPTSRRCTAGTTTRARRSPPPSASRRRFLPDAVDGWELALEEIDPGPRHVPRAPRQPRHGHRPAPQRARLRRGRPGLRARGAEPGGSVAADRDDRRGHRADLPAPARR